MEPSTTNAQKIRLLCVGRDLAGGGAERVQLTLLERLDRSKFDIKLFYLQDRGRLRLLIPQDLTPEFGVGERKSIKSSLLSVVSRLVSLAKGSDLVFAMLQGAPTYVAILVGRAVHKPVVCWMHSLWSKDLELELSGWHRWASRLIYPLADRYIAVSQGAARDLRTFLPVLKDRVTCVDNFLSLDEITRLAEEPLPDWAADLFARKVILGAGQLIPRKGFDTLIAAVARLVALGYDLRLVIIGEGPERPRLIELASELGIAERVLLPGFMTNPYPLFRHADVFVLSSTYEGFGMVVVEALALGTCVVATDCPSGPREVLDGGRFGLLVEPGDVGELGAAIARVLEDPATRAHMQAQGRIRARAYDARAGVPAVGQLLLSVQAGRPTGQ